MYDMGFTLHTPTKWFQTLWLSHSKNSLLPTYVSMKRPFCFYYITGHGFGHATRAIGWSRSYWNVDLLLKLSPLYSKTFSQIILVDSSQLSTLIVSTRSLDAGAIQLDPLQMDITQTLRTYFENIHLNYSVLLDQEVQFLSDRRPSIVLVGATPIAAAKNAILFPPGIAFIALC